MAANLSLMLLSLLMGLVFPLQGAKKTVWDGAYTNAQAERGQKAYTEHCAGCHQPDLSGKGEFPPLKGDSFMDRWHDYSVKPLFNMIKTGCPPVRLRTSDKKPLWDDIYVEITPYILKANAFPEGKEELTVGPLDQFQFLGRKGVHPPPKFALVFSIGCLTYKPISWM